jgi:hypothetical protein
VWHVHHKNGADLAVPRVEMSQFVPLLLLIP